MKQANNNASTKTQVVDCTSPALHVHSRHPFLPIGDAAYRQHGGGGPSRGHRQQAQIARVIPETSLRTDRHTHHNTSQPLPRVK